MFQLNVIWSLLYGMQDFPFCGKVEDNLKFRMLLKLRADDCVYFVKITSSSYW